MDYREDSTNPELYETLKALPKIDLHRHLEGSLRLGTMAEIARDFKINLPGYEIKDFRHLVQMTEDDETTEAAFLSKFINLRQLYRSREIIERVAYEAVEDAAKENITYLELRFTPIALARKENFPLADVTDWVIAATKRAALDHKVGLGLIISMNRHESIEIGDEMTDIAIERKEAGILAVDLCGAEAKFSGAPFAPVFHKARSAGLNVTIHAGEWAGIESVREAIDLLGATRLGHGVRIIQDSDMVRIARDRGIALEICPTSNWQSGVVSSIAQHPLKDLYQVGILTTINTDDPSISAINLTDEYVRVMENLKLTVDDIKQHIINAARASFLPELERIALVSRLKEELGMVDAQTTPANSKP
jgi:adenosine deaminase